jgi:hypothetical protein
VSFEEKHISEYGNRARDSKNLALTGKPYHEQIGLGYR